MKTLNKLIQAFSDLPPLIRTVFVVLVVMGIVSISYTAGSILLDKQVLANSLLKEITFGSILSICTMYMINLMLSKQSAKEVTDKLTRKEILMEVSKLKKQEEVLEDELKDINKRVTILEAQIKMMMK